MYMDPQIPIQQDRPSFLTTLTLLPITPSPHHTQTKPVSSLFHIAQLLLRILVFGFTLSGVITMVTSQQSVTVFGIRMNARYTYTSSFRFKLVADSLVCGLSLLSLFPIIALNHPKSNLKNYFYLLLHDLVSVILLTSGFSAAMAIGFVGRFGQVQTGWIPICDRVAKFCDKIMMSIASSFLASICLLVLTIMAAYKLKSLPYAA